MLFERDLLPGVELEVVEGPLRLPEGLEADIDAIWQEAASANNRLYNGTVYSLESCTESLIRLRAMQYKHIYALHHMPRLRLMGLEITPVGISGVLECADGIVLGCRDSFLVTDGGGLWELAPSGSLQVLPLKQQLLEEAAEELGMAKSQLHDITPLALYRDESTGVADILIRCRTSMGIEELIAQWKEKGSREYSNVIAVPREKLASFVVEYKEYLLPALPALLKLAKLT